MRAGRKRKIKERYPCGKVKPSPEELERRMTPRKPEIVDPTPETIARRTAAFGNPKAEGELCCPVDRMRHALSEEQYWAARYARSAYARYCIAIGAPKVVAGQLRDYVQGGGGTPMDTDQAQAAVKAYVELTTSIRRYSFRSLKEVERVMHGSMPRNFDAFAVGLTALADYLGYERREAA
jgi:hypothetical protein